MAKIKNNRLLILDYLRGFTIILMIFFHFFYDLNFFKFVSIDFQEMPFWYWLPRLIAGLFLFCVGASLTLAHQHKIHWRAFSQRLLIISLGALIVSLSTYFIYPDRWIYFGTLHCIALSSLAGIAFIRYPKWGLMTGIILFLLCYPLGILPMWPKLARPSLDNIPFIPWVFFVLLGMNSTHILAKIKLPKIPQGEKLIFLSKHSLKIYLLHQPLMLALVFLFWKLLP